jgi:hypothetical protein
MMTKRIRNINGEPADTVRHGTSNGFENDYVSDNYDSALFETIGQYMKGRFDLEEVKNDPAFSDTQEAVREMVREYNENIPGNNENERFIKEIFSGEGSEEGLEDEIKFIRQEINDNKLNDITAEWVKEWHEKKQKMGGRDPKTEEIRNFVTDAINSLEKEHLKSLIDGRKQISQRGLFVRYASLSAAAMLGVFLLIRTLLPSSNPEKLFSSFYKPFDAISPVTRTINNNPADSYSSAIASYKNGDYEKASAGFASVLEKDPSAISAKFLLGLSQIASKNYNKAINLLESVANDGGEYGKEARWYLGLTYVKTGNKQKAAECFKYLARSEGFYRERSEMILRRLK